MFLSGVVPGKSYTISRAFRQTTTPSWKGFDYGLTKGPNLLRTQMVRSSLRFAPSYLYEPVFSDQRQLFLPFDYN